MAGVANTGADRNWTGHPLAQANWFAFGRMAWDHTLTPATIADEWVKMTLTHRPQSVSHVTNMLLKSWTIFVDYTTPMGLSAPLVGRPFGPCTLAE